MEGNNNNNNKLHFTTLNYILIYTYHPELSESTIIILNYTLCFSLHHIIN